MVFNEAALHIAVKNNSVDMVKLLLLQPNIDVNIKTIQNQIFLSHSK